jgi:Domain of unknown function (DUF4267)
MVGDIGFTLAAIIGLFGLFLSARALLQPRLAALGFGVAAVPGVAPYMAIKASRDLAVGLVVLALLATSNLHTVATAILAATAIPLVDGAIVLRTGGPKATAYGVHFTTALVMLATVALLLAG